jgi:hypothetical protein
MSISTVSFCAIDWTDDVPRSLDDVARIAFPTGTMTADSLKRLIRKGRLQAYKPGKAYLTTLRDVRAMIEASKITRYAPDPLASDSDISSLTLDHALKNLRDRGERERAERKRLKAEERARTEPERRRRAKEGRSARAKSDEQST